MKLTYMNNNKQQFNYKIKQINKLTFQIKIKINHIIYKIHNRIR